MIVGPLALPVSGKLHTSLLAQFSNLGRSICFPAGWKINAMHNPSFERDRLPAAPHTQR